jgi:hypothetical protein
MRLTDGLTFIKIRRVSPSKKIEDKKTPPKYPFGSVRFVRFRPTTLLLPEGYSAFRQVVGRHLYHNFVSWQDPNEM